MLLKKIKVQTENVVISMKPALTISIPPLTEDIDKKDTKFKKK